MRCPGLVVIRLVYLKIVIEEQPMGDTIQFYVVSRDQCGLCTIFGLNVSTTLGMRIELLSDRLGKPENNFCQSASHLSGQEQVLT